MLPEVYCDVCRSEARYHEDNSILYGQAYGNKGVWVCKDYPFCNSYVSARSNKKPTGRLKNSVSRELSKKARSLFDKHWQFLNADNKSKNQLRNKLYQRLAKKLNIPPKEAQFSRMDDESLRRAINIMSQGSQWKYGA